MWSPSHIHQGTDRYCQLQELILENLLKTYGQLHRNRVALISVNNIHHAHQIRIWDFHPLFKQWTATNQLLKLE
jgi:hypothetical protein